MTRRIVLVLSMALISSAWTGAAAIQPASAAGPHGAFCHISGKAVFSKRLGTSARSVRYRFTGTLDNCQSNSGKYKTARISAAGAGSLSCGGGSSHGVATVRWSRRVKSVVKFTTSSLLALVDVSGKVIRGQDKGDPAHGDLLFQANPQQCQSGGVRRASFNGTTEYGNFQ